jgi:anti-anti-sigma factor
MLFRATPGEVPGSLFVEGEIDVAAAGAFGEALDQAAALGPLVLDLSGVTFMDSSGLHVLLRAAEAANGTPVVITSMGRAVRRLFNVAIPEGVPGLAVREDT